MSDLTPVHKSVEHGVSDDNAELFNKLDADRKAGALAGNRELAPEGYTAPELKIDFEEKSQEELEKMTKKELLQYAADFAANAERIADAKAEHAAKLAEQAAIHGIPRGKLGEAIAAMLEVRPDHPGRGLPYALRDDEGKERVNRKGHAVTRIDN